MYSKSQNDHIPHLKAIFERCQQYRISLNLKKSIFVIERVILLSFMISLDDIMIDLERIEVIKKIMLPHNKRSMQSFFGKINFVRRFISNFSEIAMPLQKMVKKDVYYKWTKERQDSFMNIKEEIVEAPTLWSPKFEKDFILYIFAFDYLIVFMLSQKNEVGEEFPVSFMSMGLQGAEINYPPIDK